MEVPLCLNLGKINMAPNKALEIKFWGKKGSEKFKVLVHVNKLANFTRSTHHYVLWSVDVIGTSLSILSLP